MPKFPGLFRKNNVPEWQRLHQNHDGLRQWEKVCTPSVPEIKRAQGRADDEWLRAEQMIKAQGEKQESIRSEVGCAWIEVARAYAM